MPTILISGANGNLGLTVANHMLSLGYKVIAVTGPGGAERLPAEPQLITYEVNLMDEQETEAFVQLATRQYPEIQAAILLVGGFAMGNLTETSDQMLEKMVRLNFHTAFHLVRPLFNHFMLKTGGGQFILIGSKPALNPSEGTAFFAYSLSKSMVIKLAEFINAEGKNKGISAAVIVPGTIDTKANRMAMPEADFTKWIPPANIAEAITFCLTETGRMMHDHVLKIYNRS